MSLHDRQIDPTQLAFPLYSIYHGIKWGVEGFTESLQYQVAPFNIKLKLIEPGAIKTEFYGRARVFMKPDYTSDYDAFVKKCEAVSMEAGDKGASSESLERVIFKAGFPVVPFLQFKATASLIFHKYPFLGIFCHRHTTFLVFFNFCKLR